MKSQAQAERSLPRTPKDFERWGEGKLPGLLGMRILATDPTALQSELDVRDDLHAPNGYLHAATVVALADSLCGYGSIVNLPDGAIGFTTIELKSNFLGTAREGTIRCEARPAHLGRSTHVWDAKVFAGERVIALFRCTQMILFPKVSAP